MKKIMEWVDVKLYNVGRLIIDRHFKRHPKQFPFFYAWVKNYAYKNYDEVVLQKTESFFEALNEYEDKKAERP